VTDALLARIPDANDVQTTNGRVHFTVDTEKLGGVLSALAELNPGGLTIAPPSLEELFLRHYGDELAEAGAR
jgi:ABC-2 type transport system ATP-binding protein